MSDTITTVEGRELLETVKNEWQFLNHEEFEKDYGNFLLGD